MTLTSLVSDRFLEGRPMTGQLDSLTDELLPEPWGCE